MKKLEEYRWMCANPFGSVMTYPNGRYTPCTILSRPTTQEDLEKLQQWLGQEDVTLPTVEQMTPSEWLANPWLQKFKQDFKNHDHSVIDILCKQCKTKEAAGQISNRLDTISKLDQDTKQKLEIAIDQEQHTVYHHMEMNSIIGNLCNLACNMCAGDVSSRYRSEQIKLGEAEGPVHIKPHISDDVKQDLIDNILPKVKHISFTGGEPLLSEDIFWVLDHTKQTGQTLKLATNLTNNIDKFLNNIDGFDLVEVDVSVDATKEAYNYVRYPGDFEVVSENLRKLAAHNSAKLKSAVLFTTTALNPSKVIETYRWAKWCGAGWSIGFVVNNFYSIRSIPPDIRQLHLSKLENYRRMDKTIEELIYNLVHFEFRENEMNQMLEHIKRRDKLRGTNLIDVFPEWKPYIKV